MGRPFVLGLTGGICCGKSEAARLLEALGATHVDADAISRAVTTPGGEALPDIRKTFGDGVFNEDGTLNRAALADLIFNDAEEKRRLEGIIHPLVWDRTLQQIESAQTDVVVLDVPLLFESGMDALCDETWTLSLPGDVQLERIMERDGLTEAQARGRIASQLSMAERNSRATKVFDTNRSIEDTQAELRAAYDELCARLM